MQKFNKVRNIVQVVALSAPPVLMALTGLLLKRQTKAGTKATIKTATRKTTAP